MSAPYQDHLEKLFKRYTFEKPESKLTIEQFEKLLLVFPAMLVVQTDGHIDTFEMMQLYSIGKHVMEMPEDDVRREIRSLSWSVDYWKEPFLRVLRMLIQKPEDAYNIIDMMIMTASSSTGNLAQNLFFRSSNPTLSTDQNMLTPDKPVEFISKEEKNAMIHIVEFLGVAEDPTVQSKLASL